MIYTEARPEIRSGDLLAWTHRGWRSWYDFQIQMVRMFTRSEYAHVAIAWTVGGRLFALEAVQAGVRIFPLSRLVPFYWLPMRLVWLEDTEEAALTKVGEPYSKLQAIAAYLGVLKAGTDRQWQCAEYALSVLETAGIELNCEATPSAVVAAAQERGAELRLVMPNP